MMSNSDSQSAPIRDAVLRAACRATSRFVRKREWVDALVNVLGDLGSATQSSRSYYLEIRREEPGSVMARQVHEWVASDAPLRSDHPEPHAFRIEGAGFEEWLRPCFAGLMVHGRTIDFAPQARDFLESQQIFSQLMLPVMVHGKLQGVIGFENCWAKCEWDSLVAEALAAVADTLACAIERELIARQQQASDAEALRQRHELESILDAVQAEVIYLDTAGRVIRHNRYSQGRTGLTDEEIAGRTVLHKDANWDDPELRHRETMEVIRTGQPLLQSLQWYRVGDQKCWARVDKVPTFDDSGQVNAILLFIYDITDRVYAEELLRQQEAQLTHVARLTTMGEMAAGIAHEITQPLGAIGNYAAACRTILMDVPDDRSQRALKWAERIESQAARTHLIIERLRGFARHAQPHRSTCNLNELVTEAAALCEFDLRRARVAVELHLTPEPLFVCGDRIQLQQVLVNLLRNACDALESQPFTERLISITTRSEHTEMEIIVSDNGPGIAETDLPHVFEAFYTTKPSGMGIGLAVSRKIVDAHGGKLRAANRPTRGCEFTLTLPKWTVATEDSGTFEGRGQEAAHDA